MITRLLIALYVVAFVGVGIPAKVFAQEITQTLLDITFDETIGDNPWLAERFARAIIRGDALHIEANQGEPQISRRDEFLGGEFRLIIELRTGTESNVCLYWTRTGSFARTEDKRVSMPLIEDGRWHTYEFVFKIPDVLQSMMLRFSATDGTWEIRSIRLIRRSRPPLSVKETVPIVHEMENGQVQNMIRFTISNDTPILIQYRIGTQAAVQTLPSGRTENLGVPIRVEGNLASAILTLHPNGFPSIVAPVFLYYPEGTTNWMWKSLGNGMALEIAHDARMGRIWNGNDLVGIIAPLVHRQGAIPRFVLAESDNENDLHFTSDDVDLRIVIDAPLVHFDITSKTEHAAPLEGPTVRLFGELRSGLLPGVEFLRAGGMSSSEIDVARPYHDRSRPNPQWITMPLAVLETERGGAALYWEDANLQPTFSAPNRFDHTEDHRFSLIGPRIVASLELMQAEPVPASFRAIRSHVARKGFPPPAPALRTDEEQHQLFMRALTGRLQSEMGGQWGYALEPQWERQPFTDMFSTQARLMEAAGERWRNPTVLVSGGSDITNDAIYFLTGRIPEWQQQREAAIRQIMARVNADGSFLYRTRYSEYETAASSFGYTAMQAQAIMEYVRITGNDELFAVVRRALDYLDQCDVPRGGFYSDTPFQTPDLQAAATLVWLYTWAYEFSGNTHYLDRAVHFAFAGLPFVYQTEHKLYGTVGKFGAAHRRPPLHFGVVSTRVGIQYAYALNLLSRHDEQTDWKAVARGILRTMENLQFTEGEAAGCIPELFDVVTRERRGMTVNPCALVSLRWAVENKVDSLFVLVEGRHRFTAPYPLRSTSLGIEAYNVPAGQRFHVLQNANRLGTGEGNGLITMD